MEFDANKAPKEPGLICFICQKFKPLIKTQIEQHRREFNSWDKLVKKIINIKTKANF